jgi:hypothetical protein
MSIAKASVEQQIAMLREQTRITGGLHHAQVTQLKMWPMVAFDIIVGSSFTWDPKTKVVKFKLDLPSKPPARKLEWWKERVGAVQKWVHSLLGDEWMIQVVAGKKTFNGSRKINAGRAGAQPGAKTGAAH